MEFMVENSILVKKYIIFCSIKSFSEALEEVYGDEPLQNYNRFIQNANLLTDMDLFIDTFSLDAKHRSKFCENAYINIPKFLKGEHKDTIQRWLTKLAKVFENPFKTSKEYNFIKSRINTTIENFPHDPPEITSEKCVQTLLEQFKPNIRDTVTMFNQEKLDIEKLVKIILLFGYEKRENVNSLDIEDKEIIDQILQLTINTHIKNIKSLMPELMRLLLSIKNLKNLPFQQMFMEMNGKVL
nr:MAG: hypothetical protein DiTV3a_F3ORF4 [Diabrotica toursvirus 3a]